MTPESCSTGLPGVGQFPRRQRASFAWNWVPTSSLTNEVRGGFYRPRSLFVTNVEFPEGNRLTFPTIGTAVTNPVQNSLGSGRNVDLWELTDNASWVKATWCASAATSGRSPSSRSAPRILPAYTIGFGTNNANPLSAGNAGQFPGGSPPTTSPAPPTCSRCSRER